MGGLLLLGAEQSSGLAEAIRGPLGDFGPALPVDPHGRLHVPLRDLLEERHLRIQICTVVEEV